MGQRTNTDYEQGFHDSQAGDRFPNLASEDYLIGWMDGRLCKAAHDIITDHSDAFPKKETNNGKED